uniref:Uncharacterized protein n=1 Tax=Arundo donax TaxID=35708 RepID=A0A0A9U4N3_ARUDO
MPQLQPCH